MATKKVLKIDDRPTPRNRAAMVVAEAKRREYLKTPMGFAKGVLGHSIWTKQYDIMRDVVTTPERRVAVKSCHASGKTFISADIAISWITTNPDGIAVTTAPTWTQVDKLLWGEIRNTVNNPGCKIKYPSMSATELKLGEKNYAIGISTNNSARFQGFHSGRVLIILDEAPGVRPEVWEAINGLRAGGDVRMLAIGNPVIVGGEFYDAFTTKRAMWKTHTISAFDTPNLLHTSLRFQDETGQDVQIGSGKDLMEMSDEDLDRNKRPYLCTRRWVKEMFTEWGLNHPYFQSRVLGEFPTQGDDALIPLSWLEKLKLSEAKSLPGDRVRAGLDVAGPGEAETVLAVMRGDRLLSIRAWPQADPRGEVVAALMPYREEIESINVDTIGIGWGMFTHLRDIFNLPTATGGKRDVVHAINVGDAPRDKKKFANAKAEHYWSLRLRVQAGELLGLDDEKAIGQLSVIKYRHNSRGLIEIESKDDLRKRGVKSPDRAEAIMLCNARHKGASGLFSLDLSMGGASAGGAGDGLTRSSSFHGAGSGESRWSE